ncbi:class I SAM-dependent methyltransferase [Flavobacterium hercynium]|uniref:class I SAM-dependent methyltransferase n=1 Tax=Flavobacterium hercynium TaxID=387094 RepID=UPI00240306CA|nr:Methyltransferase domain-containing protein [Flavobacterium hercynium]
MKENKYDEVSFFEQYEKMSRSQKGLEGAGEWHVLKQMLPDFAGKKVLDLGCGYGWHCRYAIENGAQSAIGIDISEKNASKSRRN